MCRNTIPYPRHLGQISFIILNFPLFERKYETLQIRVVSALCSQIHSCFYWKTSEQLHEVGYIKISRYLIIFAYSSWNEFLVFRTFKIFKLQIMDHWPVLIISVYYPTEVRRSTSILGANGYFDLLPLRG